MCFVLWPKPSCQTCLWKFFLVENSLNHYSSINSWNALSGILPFVWEIMQKFYRQLIDVAATVLAYDQRLWLAGFTNFEFLRHTESEFEHLSLDFFLSGPDACIKWPYVSIMVVTISSKVVVVDDWSSSVIQNSGKLKCLMAAMLRHALSKSLQFSKLKNSEITFCAWSHCCLC